MINQHTTIKNNRKVKAMGNIAHTMDNYAKNRQMEGNDLESDMPY